MIDDNLIEPGSGFGKHGHRNRETARSFGHYVARAAAKFGDRSGSRISLTDTRYNPPPFTGAAFFQARERCRTHQYGMTKCLEELIADDDYSKTINILGKVGHTRMRSTTFA